MFGFEIYHHQGGHGNAPGDRQLSLGWYPTPGSGVLNLGGRAKNAGGIATEQPVYFVVKVSRTDW